VSRSRRGEYGAAVMKPAAAPHRRRWWRGALLSAAALLVAACFPPPPPPASSPLVQAACEGRLQGVVAGQVESGALTETSGVAASTTNPGVLWAHNDSGDTARVFAMTASGGHLGWFGLDGASAIDWEDMAIGPGPLAGRRYLYVGDLGDNQRVRESVVVYRVAEPGIDQQQPPGDGQTLEDVEAFVLRYPDGAHDAEALLVDPATGDLVIVTKEASGQAGVYTHPAGATGETLSRQDPLVLGSGVLVTGGDAAPDGETVVLRTYTSVLVFPRPAGRPLHEALAASRCTGASAAEQQGEAIAVTADSRGYVTISEGTQPPVNRFEITGG
jgi:hypothetical protein